MSPGSSVVALDRAAVRLDGRDVWRDATLQVGQGEFVAVLGPNGAGKSTLLKALLGLVPLSAGTAEVFGRPVRRGNPEIGYLPQRRRFDPDLRIRAADLVRLGLDGASWGVPTPSVAKRSRVADMIELGCLGLRAARHRRAVRRRAAADPHRPGSGRRRQDAA